MALKHGNALAVYNSAGITLLDGDSTSLFVDVNGGLIISNRPYAPGATVVTNSSGNVANATAAATLTGVAAKTMYLSGFEVTGAGATAGAVVTVTVTGTISGTLSYTYVAATGAAVANTPLIVEFTDAIPASAVNTSIVVSCPALGAGNTNNTTVAHGYYL